MTTFYHDLHCRYKFIHSRVFEMHKHAPCITFFQVRVNLFWQNIRILIILIELLREEI